MSTYSLFEVYGIEIEYMIVDRDTLAVMPISDKLLHALSGKITDEIELGEIALSNELALHVIEFKTNGPTTNLSTASSAFQKSIELANEKLAAFNAMLLPTGAHPWMDPYQELKLWPYGQQEIYKTYHRLFDCRGHGWANLQSTHLNLPFATEEEFVKLHTAIRFLLPIIPALTASTPILDSKLTGLTDTRLFYYQNNQKRFPQIAGLVIPESIKSYAEYHERILHPMYQSIAYYDTEQLLQEEWLNSRGAIARFERNAIEIRVLDTQESPKIDIAIIDLIVESLKNLVYQKNVKFEDQIASSTEELANIFQDVIREGLNATVSNLQYLKAFNIDDPKTKVRDLWKKIIQGVKLKDSKHEKVVNDILIHGNLSDRIKQVCKEHASQSELLTLYKNLGRCLASNHLFLQETL